MGADGKDPGDPASWTEPVVRLVPSERGPFRDAINTHRLHLAFDQLVGKGRWLARPDCGLFVVRFPVATPPGDTGWHVDASYRVDDAYRVNLWSRDRALLMLPLFSDIGDDDAPTRLRVGSHLDVPPILAPAGGGGMDCERALRPGLRCVGRPPRRPGYGQGGRRLSLSSLRGPRGPAAPRVHAQVHGTASAHEQRASRARPGRRRLLARRGAVRRALSRANAPVS